MVLQQSSTWSVGTSLTYLFRFHAIDHGAKYDRVCFKNKNHNTVAYTLAVAAILIGNTYNIVTMTDVYLVHIIT